MIPSICIAAIVITFLLCHLRITKKLYKSIKAEFTKIDLIYENLDNLHKKLIAIKNQNIGTGKEPKETIRKYGA